MRRPWLVSAAGLTTGLAAFTFILFGLDGSLSQSVALAWPAIAIAWLMKAIAQAHVQDICHRTIAIQARVIRNQSETLTHHLTEEDKHDQ